MVWVNDLVPALTERLQTKQDENIRNNRYFGINLDWKTKKNILFISQFVQKQQFSDTLAPDDL